MTNIVTLRNTGGFTRMDNELYEALIGADLSGRELRVALAVHRQTAGYNVQEARIAASYIAEMANIHREDVSRIISELLRQRVVYRTGGSRSPMGIAPVSEWKIDSKNTRKNDQQKAPQCGVSTTSKVAFLPHNKDSKDNLVPSELVAAAAATDAAKAKIAKFLSVAAENATSSAAQIAELLNRVRDALITEEGYGPLVGEALAAQAQAIAELETLHEAAAKREAQAERIPYQRIVDLYNAICGEAMPRCIKLTDKRRKAIRRCWNMDFRGKRPFQSLEFWELYLQDCMLNKHWTGNNDRGWTADIEFLTREDKVLKVLEGGK